MKKRLLKDLPFSDLKAGDVIFAGSRGVGGKYSISSFGTYYETGSSSDGGITVFDDREEEILDAIWDNEEWFEPAELKHIDFVLKRDGIFLRFDPIDAEEIEELAKGIAHILPELQKGSYVWNKFKGITTSIKNH